MRTGNGSDTTLSFEILKDFSSFMSDHNIKSRDIYRKLDALTAKVEGLTEAAAHYHASVVGHGMMLSELDKRLCRIEEHLGLRVTAG